jgi:hypothetical protein
MKRSTAVIGALTLGLGMALAAPTAAAAEESVTLYVPDDIDFSQTRVNGHYAVTEAGGLHIWTDGSSDIGPDGRNSDKVAGYVATSTPLAGVGQLDLDYTNTAGGLPGYQLVVDFDGDGTDDGILVGESVYNGPWWLADAKQFAKDAAPHEGGGFGSPYYGTLEEWAGVEGFENAEITAFGFSLGSGVKGDGVINAIIFDGTRYTFAEHVVVADKNGCKNNGWTTSTKPVFKNQGDCVSSFATTKTELAGFRI